MLDWTISIAMVQLFVGPFLVEILDRYKKLREQNNKKHLERIRAITIYSIVGLIVLYFTADSVDSKLVIGLLGPGILLLVLFVYLKELIPTLDRKYFAIDQSAYGIIRIILIGPIFPLVVLITRTFVVVVNRILAPVAKLLMPVFELLGEILDEIFGMVAGVGALVAGCAIMLLGLVVVVWLIKTIWNAV